MAALNREAWVILVRIHEHVALAEQQGQSIVFKVQAFAPNVYEPLWTFTPGDKQGIQIAFAVAVGPLGEVYAGGIGATNHPVFAVISG